MIILQPYIYEIIRNEIQKLEDSHKKPLYITDKNILDHVRNDVYETIEELVQDGLIKKSENINGIPLYKIKEPW